MDSEHPSLFAGTSACIQKRSGLVPTALVFSFGFETVFWSVCFGCMRTWLDEMGSSIAITQWARWIGSSVLVCGYFSMYTEEVWIGSNSIGLFVWSRKCVLVCLLWLHAHMAGWNGWLYYCRSSWARWIGSSVLVCRYFSMYTEEVWIGSNSVGLFIWSQKCVWYRRPSLPPTGHSA